MGLTDAKIIADPDLWPKWPYLPLKKLNHHGGFLYYDSRLPITVYLGNLWRHDPIEKLEKIQYRSIELMLTDGWKID
jgi:hypothetical protein